MNFLFQLKRWLRLSSLFGSPAHGWIRLDFVACHKQNGHKGATGTESISLRVGKYLGKKKGASEAPLSQVISSLFLFFKFGIDDVVIGSFSRTPSGFSLGLLLARGLLVHNFCQPV